MECKQSPKRCKIIFERPLIMKKMIMISRICSTENNYQEDKCQKYIAALVQCCIDRAPDESIVCSGMHKNPAVAKHLKSRPPQELD